MYTNCCYSGYIYFCRGKLTLETENCVSKKLDITVDIFSDNV